MKSVRIADPGAAVMSWFGVGFLGLLLLMVAAAFVMMMRHALGSGGVPMAGLATLGGFLAAIAAAAWALRTPVWRRVYRIDIAGDGAWTLRNPLGRPLVVLPPGQERMLHARPYTLTQFDSNSFVQVIERAEITVALPSERTWIVHTNEFPGVLAKLGYDITWGTDVQQLDAGHFAVPPHHWQDGELHWV